MIPSSYTTIGYEDMTSQGITTHITSNNCFSYLSRSLQQSIFLHLDEKNLARCTQVCKAWNTAIQDPIFLKTWCQSSHLDRTFHSGSPMNFRTVIAFKKEKESWCEEPQSDQYKHLFGGHLAAYELVTFLYFSKRRNIFYGGNVSGKLVIHHPRTKKTNRFRLNEKAILFVKPISNDQLFIFQSSSTCLIFLLGDKKIEQINSYKLKPFSPSSKIIEIISYKAGEIYALIQSSIMNSNQDDQNDSNEDHSTRLITPSQSTTKNEIIYYKTASDPQPVFEDLPIEGTIESAKLKHQFLFTMISSTTGKRVLFQWDRVTKSAIRIFESPASNSCLVYRWHKKFSISGTNLFIHTELDPDAPTEPNQTIHSISTAFKSDATDTSCFVFSLKSGGELCSFLLDKTPNCFIGKGHRLFYTHMGHTIQIMDCSFKFQDKPKKRFSFILGNKKST